MFQSTMDQENTMDFKALRAKFQDGDLLQKQPKLKPVLPDKPKQVPPSQSPTHYLPAGARPSLLTSINQSLEAKSTVIPRVVFKDDKKESKMPLIQTKSKGKDKSEGKQKGKDKTSKATKAKADDMSSEQKQKKENSKDKRFSLVMPAAQKDNTADLVPATPPPKSSTLKKGFMGFRKSSKRNSVEISPDPILDSLSPDIFGPAPLIPVPSDFQDASPQTEISAPNGLLLDIAGLPDSSDTMEITPPPIIPDIPNFSPPPSFIPETPFAKVAAPESETPLETETPALPVSRPASQIKIIPSPPRAASTPPPSHSTASAPSVASTPSISPPEPEVAAEAAIEAVQAAAVAPPPAPVEDSKSILPSPKLERPISALSALERAEDMSPGKRTSPGDQRIFSALEKARRKTTSPLTNVTTSYSATPPLEEHPLPQIPTSSHPELPPIDYEDRAGNAIPSKSAFVNGLDHAQAFPLLEGITEEAPETVPELLVVQPPPPKKVLPDRSSLGPPPEKPARPPSVDLSEFIPPHSHVEDNPSSAELPVSAEVPETDTTDAPVFAEVASDSHSPNLPVSESGNGEYTGPETPYGQTLPDHYSNGITAPVPAAHEVSVLEDEYQDNAPLAGSEAEAGNHVYESTENVYEDVNASSTKKKGKPDGGKKRKGPPKNPYDEAAQMTKEEKTKTGRFGKGEKKVTAEGPDAKELKKKEKQRLEKEKRELKEKQEREKKEQKEREKKENEMKKKFKVTGHEEAMYQAKVTATTKGQKNHLPVNTGEVVSIIRTTNCPKGKWLARDGSGNYGYVAVDHVELDIREMVELGKKTAINRVSGSNFVDGEVTSTGSKASNHYPLSSESFSDDSEEWTVDEEDALSPAREITDPLSPTGHSRTFSMPDMGNKDLSINHQHSHSDISAGGPRVQARHEALQKLSTFFHSPKPAEPAASATVTEMSPVPEKEVHAPGDKAPRDLDFEHPDMLILPPPDLYA